MNEDVQEPGDSVCAAMSGRHREYLGWLMVSVLLAVSAAACLLVGQAEIRLDQERRRDIVTVSASATRNDTSLSSWCMWIDESGDEHTQQLPMFTREVRDGFVLVEYHRNNPSKCWVVRHSPHRTRLWPGLTRSFGWILSAFSGSALVMFGLRLLRPPAPR